MKVINLPTRPSNNSSLLTKISNLEVKLEVMKKRNDIALEVAEERYDRLKKQLEDPGRLVQALYHVASTGKFDISSDVVSLIEIIGAIIMRQEIEDPDVSGVLEAHDIGNKLDKFDTDWVKALGEIEDIQNKKAMIEDVIEEGHRSTFIHSEEEVMDMRERVRDIQSFIIRR